MDKLVDEYLKRVVTLQTYHADCSSNRTICMASKNYHLLAESFRKMLSEQNNLERLAKDGDSPVCQVKQTFDL